MFSRLVATIVAVVLTAPGTLVATGAGTSAKHCQTMGHECGDFMLKACCCDAGDASRSLPATPPDGRSSSAGGAPVVAQIPIALMPPAMAAGRILAAWPAPPHGFRTTDLSILLSVFLI
jgi:hypothetical protein